MDRVALPLVRNEAVPLRDGKLEGKEFLVVPAIMMTEGVWNGLLYPADELRKSADAWNGRPVCINHPTTLDGDRVSATSSPATLEEFGIGMLFNTEWDAAGKKLKTEAWIDKAKTAASDKGKLVVNQIKEGRTMDVSTGLFIDVLPVPGEFNGTVYKGIATNHRPDHLAALPNKKGACSTEDGAGIPRVNEKESGTMTVVLEAILSVMKRLVPERPATNADKGADTMDKKTMIETLMKNGWGEEDKPILDTLSEKQLQRLLPKEEPKKPEEKKPEEPTKPATNVATPAAPAAPVITPEAFLAAMPAEMREAFDSMKALHANQKATLVSKLAGNARCEFPKESLEKMSLADLQRLARMANVNVDFSVTDVTPGSYTENADEGNPMPRWDWEKDQMEAPASKKA